MVRNRVASRRGTLAQSTQGSRTQRARLGLTPDRCRFSGLLGKQDPQICRALLRKARQATEPDQRSDRSASIGRNLGSASGIPKGDPLALSVQQQIPRLSGGCSVHGSGPYCIQRCICLLVLLLGTGVHVDLRRRSAAINGLSADTPDAPKFCEE